MAHGWTRPEPIAATKEVIGPLTGGLLGMIFLPGLIFHMMQYFLLHVSLDNRFICKSVSTTFAHSNSTLAPLVMHVYPTVFVLAATLRSAVVAFDLLSSWSQAIRDKEFLVEMKLRNHEPEVEKGVGEEVNGVRNDEIRLPPLGLAAEEAHHNA